MDLATPACMKTMAIHATVGQTPIGRTASASHGVGAGYWYGMAVSYQVYLPPVLRGAGL